MPLDTRIALTGQPLQLESPLAQYGQLMGVVNAGTQNQLAQMQMSAAQRAMQEDEGLKNYLAGNPDLTTAEGQRGAMQFGAKGQALIKSFVDQAKDKAQTSLYSAQADELRYKSETQKLDKALNEISNFPDAASALASIDTQVSRKIISPEQASQLKAQINAAPDFSTWQRRTVTGMMAAKDRLEMLEEERYIASRKQPAAAPAAATPTAPINATEAPLARPTQAAVPLDKLNVTQDANGTKTYYLDGVPIPEEKFVKLYAASAASAPLSNTRAAALAAMTPAAAAPAPAPAPAPPAVAAAPTLPVAAAPAPAQPDMANALALKIQGLQEEQNKLEPFLKSSSAKAKYDNLGKQIDNLSKGFSISAGGAYTIPGVGMIERPPTASEFEQLLKDSGMTENEKKVARASRVAKQSTFAPPMQVVMPVAVEDPSRPGSVIYVDRSEAVGKTPATAIEGLGPKEIQAREAKYPQAITALKGFDAKTFKLERDIDDLIENKNGLNEITGFLAGRTDLSAMSNAGRRALATFNTITAKGGFSELQDMRNASPTGGALGNVSNIEGQQLIASFGALARTQNADDLRSSLTTIKSDLQGSKQRVKEAFDETYAYRANRGKTAAPAVNVDALLDKYK